MKKFTRATTLTISCLLLLVALQACEEISNPSAPTDTAAVYTVTAASQHYLKEGPSYNWSHGNDSNGLYYWAYTSTAAPYNAVVWKVPFSTSGRYDLQAYIPNLHGLTGTVTYQVTANGKQHSVSVNQSKAAGSWVNLGNYYFSGDGSEYIELSNTANHVGNRIVFDAIRWIAQ